MICMYVCMYIRYQTTAAGGGDGYRSLVDDGFCVDVAPLVMPMTGVMLGSLFEARLRTLPARGENQENQTRQAQKL